ncbi:RNA-binding S4 domain-containing protein [Acidithiobacillus sp. AMEEHan]|uniref:RNA-binding S4 domain-containing protein n=1 Tax=Acidithiobacillus sp. AMEEHan TaxID=2994951 RepID=UPI0027E504D5|nr:RNA-binding S4 domain-containing protein [Acidithiobacillus sp. AMEEHan]
MAEGQRLDLFLKMSRLIKRRSVAKTLCDAGRVQLNGRTAKAGTLVQAGDRLRLDLPQGLVEAAILRLPTRVEGPDGVVSILGTADSA